MTGSLHYMRNDYRVGKRQVSFVCPEWLWLAVKEQAAVRGCSVSDLVRDALASEVAVEPREQQQATGHTPAWAEQALQSKYQAARAGEGVVVEADPLEEIA